MSIIMTWVKDFFLVIISVTFFRLLIPDSAMRKYTDFVFSMIIMVMILKPVTSLFTFN